MQADGGAFLATADREMRFSGGRAMLVRWKLSLSDLLWQSVVLSPLLGPGQFGADNPGSTEETGRRHGERKVAS